MKINTVLRKNAISSYTSLRYSFSKIIFKLFSKVLKTLCRGFFTLYDIIASPFQSTMYAYYSLDICPTSFDTCSLLQAIDAECRKRGLKKVHLVLYFDCMRKEKEYGIMQDIHGQRWRFENIVLPLISLFPIVTSYGVYTSKRKAMFALKPSMKIFPSHPLFPHSYSFHVLHKQMFQNSATLKCSWGIQTSPSARRYVTDWITNTVGNKKLIVITVRNSPYAKGRNNKLDEWKKFVDSCDKNKYFFVFVMDSDVIFKGIPNELKGQTFFDAACWNMGIRAALYELAYMNLSTHVGPIMTCYFNQKCRLIMFKAYTKGEPSASEELILSLGFKKNEDFPWPNPYQKIVWEEDDFPVIKQEFDTLCKTIETGSK